MALGKRQHLLAIGLLASTLVAVLIGRLHYPGNRPGEDEDRSITLAGHTLPVQALAFGPDGTTLTTAAYHIAAAAQSIEVTDWNVATGQPTAKRPAPLRAVHSLAFARGGRVLAAVCKGQGIQLWETGSSHQGRRLGEYNPLVRAVAFSRDGGQLATADFEDVVTLWDVVSGQPRARCQGNVLALAFAPDGAVLATGEADNTVRLWDVATGQPRATLQGHARPVMALTFSPDGALVVSAEFRGTVKLWDMAARQERATLEVNGDEVSALAFSPDGRTLAVAVDQGVQLWDMTTSNLVARLEGHTGNVRCLAYSPDGTRLASGANDHTVRLWDVARY
jgi:WD40 repeat protein